MHEQNQGREWESVFADEFGLSLVPGSGALWYSGKLDTYGKGARWSLKWTSKDSFRITVGDIEEAIIATLGMSGTGEIPLWAFSINGYEMIMMRKEDFKAIQSGELNVVPQKTDKLSLRTRLADVPALLREE